MNNEDDMKEDFSDVSSSTIFIECKIAQEDVFPLTEINIKEEPIEYENVEEKIPLQAIKFVQNVDSEPKFLEIEDCKISCNLDSQNVGDDFKFKSENSQMDCIPPAKEVFDVKGMNDDKIYYCSKCSFKLDSRHSYTLHLNTQHIVNTGKKLFKCNLCGCESKYKANIERHMKNKHTTDCKYKCQQCTYQTDFIRGMRRHLTVIHGKVNKTKPPVKRFIRTLEKMYKCKLCQYESKHNSNMARHLKNKHKGHKCPKCIYETDCEKKLKEHITAHDIPDDNNGKMFVDEFMRTPEKIFKCTFCKHESKYRWNMEKHIQNMHREHKCPKCIYKTDRKSELKEHLITHGANENIDGKLFVRTAQKLYKCKLCEYESKYQSNTERHILNNHDRTSIKKHKCPHCEYRTHYMGQMKRHLLIHDNIKPYECEVCNKRFRRSHHLKSHSTMHSDEKRFQCLYCDYKNNHKINFIFHMKDKHIKPENKDYKCTQCPYETNYKYNLNLHFKRHLLDGDKEFKCTQCSYDTNFKSDLKIHVQNKHEEVKKYKCKQCKYETNRKTNMKQHKLNHDSVKLYKCNICDKLFKSNYSLKNHGFTHSDEKKFQCAHCDYKTNYKLYLVVHVNSKHTVVQDKEYRCTKCNYETNSHRGYKRHLKNHLMKIQTVFKCSQCTYRTNVKGFLKRHYFHDHDNVKPFECYICSQHFQEKMYLSRHIQRMHISEKKYNCKECNYKTNVKLLFTGHILTHHLS